MLKGFLEKVKCSVPNVVVFTEMQFVFDIEKIFSDLNKDLKL